MKKAKKIEIIFEFLVFGIVIGITEDILAVWLVTGERITWEVIGLVVLIAIPFAILGELVADNVDMTKYIERFLHKRKEKKARG